MNYYISSNELSHYGVLGMRWGIRRYQPYPKGYNGSGEFKDINRALKGKGRGDRFKKDHVIPKGTTFYRTAPKGDPASKNRKDIYVTYLDPDRDRYRSNYRNVLKSINEDSNLKMRERSYILKDNLKVPGEDVQRSVVEKVMKDRNNIYKAGRTFVDNLRLDDTLSVDNVSVVLSKPTPGEYLETYKKVKNMSESEYKKAYDMALEKVKGGALKSYIKLLTSSNPEIIYGWQNKAVSEDLSIRNQVISELEKNGYNAMIDLDAAGGTGKYDLVKGIEPLIIFDNKHLEFKSEINISSNTKKKAEKDYDKWLRKARKQQENNDLNKWAW